MIGYSVFWEGTLRPCASGCRRFKGPYCFHLQGQALQEKCILLLARFTLYIKAVNIFVASVISHQSTQHAVSTNHNLQQHRCEEKSRSSFFKSAHFNVSASNSSDIFKRQNACISREFRALPRLVRETK